MRRLWILPSACAALLLLTVLSAREKNPLPTADLRFDGNRAFADLEDLVKTFGPRPTGRPQTREVARWIEQRFEAAGADARTITGSVRNVHAATTVAMLPGAGDRFIVVLGHHDSVPDAPGAEDNASAVAALLELARALRGRPLGHTIVLAATDAEETGGAGAELLLADLGKDRVARTDACIGLEMLAWPGGAPVLHALNRNYAAQARGYVPGTLPARIAAAAPEPVPLGDPAAPLLVQSLARSISAGTGSDDVFFLREGVPALFLSRSSLRRFYPHYHTERDTPDKLSAGALQSSGRILEAAVLALDVTPPRRDDSPEFLLWRTSLLTQRHLAGVALVPALACAGLALWLRRRDRAAALGAALLALPLLSAALRFQPALLLVAWPLGAAYPALFAIRERVPRAIVFWTAGLPLVLLALTFAAAFVSFGVTMALDDAVPLLVSGAFAAAGFALGRRGARWEEEPAGIRSEPPGGEIPGETEGQ